MNYYRVDDALQVLGDRIANLRGRKTQRDVARQAKIDVSTISRIERGQHDPSFSSLTAIARALEVDIGVLLGAAPPPTVVDRSNLLDNPEAFAAAIRASRGISGITRPAARGRETELSAPVADAMMQLEKRLFLRMREMLTEQVADPIPPPDDQSPGLKASEAPLGDRACGKLDNVATRPIE